jgi:hypothetical protein
MRTSFARQLSSSADRFASFAAYLAATEVVAIRHGVAAERVRRGLTQAETARVALSARGLGSDEEARIATARHEAIYLAVTVFGRSHKSIARAAGISPPAVRKALTAIEDRRDEPRFDRELDELELQLMGGL